MTPATQIKQAKAKIFVKLLRIETISLNSLVFLPEATNRFHALQVLSYLSSRTFLNGFFLLKASAWQESSKS